jgi:hypothetical protein
LLNYPYRWERERVEIVGAQTDNGDQRVLPERAIMTFSKPLAVAAIVVLGLGLTAINNARRGEDKAQPTVKPHQTAATAHPQGAGGLSNMQTADSSDPHHIAPGPQRPAGGPPRGEQSGEQWGGYADYGGAPYEGAPPVGGPYGVSVGGPYVYWAPGRWYPYPGFGDKRPLNMPPPEGVWSR